MFSRVHPAWRYLGGTGLALAVLVLLLAGPELYSRRGEPPIVVYCAAGLRGPVTAISQEYERATGRRVEPRFDGSEALLNSLLLGVDGDVYFPADESYIAMAQERGLAMNDVVAIATQRAVLVVPADNRKNILSWDDLFDKKAAVAQAQPDAAAIGRLTRKHLRTTGRWDRLERQTQTYLGTVTEVMNAVSLPSVDAGIVWDVLAASNPRVRIVPARELDGIEARIQAGVLGRSRNVEAARNFMAFVAAPEGGLKHFRAHGFRTIEER